MVEVRKTDFLAHTKEMWTECNDDCHKSSEKHPHALHLINSDGYEGVSRVISM